MNDLPDPSGDGTSTLTDARVSYHAVTRYVQRILHISLLDDWPDEKTCARDHAFAAGMSIADVRELIWSPGIALAVQMRLPSVSNGVFHALISPDTGVITTISPARKRDRSKLKLLSERELIRKGRKNSRRLKRRPTSVGLQNISNREERDDAEY